MKIILAFILSAACTAAMAAQPAANTYKAAMNKAENDYKVAKAKCDATTGHAKDLCVDQAKLERTQAEADAASQYKAKDSTQQKARVNVADAEYKLARTRCGEQSGDAKDSCLSDARAKHTLAVADAKAGRAADTAQRSTTSRDTGTSGTTGTSGSRDTGSRDTGSRDTSTAGTSGTGTGSRDTGTAQRSNDRDTGSVADRGRDTAQRAGDTMSDSMITTRVKADIFREPNLKAGDIHVETTQGVVMLSGFVNNKSEADRAIEVARSVKGVQDVKSALKVK